MYGFKQIVSGIGLCFFIMYAGGLCAEWFGGLINDMRGLSSNHASPISGIFIAILLGLLIRNTIGLHDIFAKGIHFSQHYLLKLGIIFLGMRLSLFDIITLGTWGIPIILLCVLTGLFVTVWITKKMKQPHRLGTLTAVGTGICGVTAIVGTSPGIKANKEETAYAIANITVFGMFAMFFYPYLAHLVFENDPVKTGLFLGTAIHETAQVAGAALMYNEMYNMPQAIDVATITKLTRNVFLVMVVPIMSYYYMKNSNRSEKQTSVDHIPKWYRLIPLFVLGFLACAVIRTWGDAGISTEGVAFGLWDAYQWMGIWSSLNKLGSHYILGMAMAAVGLSTSFTALKGIGMKPFYIGFAAAASVGIVSFLIVYFLADYIRL